MNYQFASMTIEYAQTIVAEWKYGGEYALHDYVNEADHILDETGWGKGLFAVLDQEGQLVGELTITFFGQDDEFIPYDELDREKLAQAEMWVGFGLKPELTGHGLGQEFVSVCIEYALAHYQYPGEYVRLGVPAINERAIKVYRRLGFEPFDRVTGEIAGQSVEVVWMRKRLYIDADVSIRLATVEDSTALAHIQVDSYQTAYAAILPQEYLDHFTYAEQEQDWRDWFSSGSTDILLVAEMGAGEIVGYGLGRPGPSGVPPYDGELVALHVRQSYQRQGVGRQLVVAIAAELQARGATSLMLWVLAENPVRSFYERLGGQWLDRQQEMRYWDGDPAIEVAYGWPDIGSLCQDG